MRQKSVKRIEMLEIIREAGDPFRGQLMNDGFFDRYYDAILTAIEDAGMEPPPVQGAYVDGVVPKRYWQK